MTRLPALKASEVIRALERHGFAVVLIKGSHHMMEHNADPTRRMTVPLHKGKDLPRGLLHKIAGPAGGNDIEAVVDGLIDRRGESGSLLCFAAALGQLGRTAETRAALEECHRLKPDIPVIRFAEAEPYKNRADTEHLIEGLRKAGLDA